MPRQPKPFFWRNGYYTDFGGQRRKLNSSNMADARKELKRLQLDVIDENKITESQPKIRLKQLIDKFGEAIQVEGALSEETIKSYRCHLRKMVEFFGNPVVTEITSKQVKEWRLDMLKRKMTHAAVNVRISICKRLFNWAIDDEIVSNKNPFRRIPRGPEKNRERLMTQEEFDSIISYAHQDSDFVDILTALRYTPARPSDFCRAEWSMLNESMDLLTLPQHKTKNTAKIKKPRYIYIPPNIKEILLKRLARNGNKRYIFTQRSGNKFRPGTISIKFRQIREKLGIKPDVNGEQLVPYCARHTIITEAVRKGVTGPQLQILGGWTNLLTARKYVHLNESDALNVGKIAADAIAEQTKQVRDPDVKEDAQKVSRRRGLDR